MRIDSASEEHPLLLNRRLDVATAVLLAIATAGVFALMWFPSTQSNIQRVDDAFLRTMTSVRAGAFTALAHVLNILGSAWITLPVRAAVGLYLAVTRRWWHFAALVGAMVLSEISIGTLKALYDRPRPPGSLVATSGGSFPSGHAVAASVTAVALVIALFPPSGIRRWLWGLGAALFSFVMALSRAYLAAHWLSDAIAGTLLGTTIALGTALLIEWIRNSRGPAPTDHAGRTHVVLTRQRKG
jgi:membrane-associated phospholipid phosphatase